MGNITEIPLNGDGSGGLPDQSGQNGKFLTTNGSAASWDTPSGGGGITPSYVSAGGGSQQTSTDIQDDGFNFTFGSGDIQVSLSDPETSITFDADSASILFNVPGTYYVDGSVALNGATTADTGNAISELAVPRGSNITLPFGGSQADNVTISNLGTTPSLFLPFGGLVKIVTANTGPQLIVSWTGANQIIAQITAINIFRIA